MRRKLGLFGHVCRMKNNRKIKDVMMGMMEGTGVTGQNISPAGVYYGLGQFIPRVIFWPRQIPTPSGHNIPRGIN